MQFGYAVYILVVPIYTHKPGVRLKIFPISCKKADKEPFRYWCLNLWMGHVGSWRINVCNTLTAPQAVKTQVSQLSGVKTDQFSFLVGLMTGWLMCSGLSDTTRVDLCEAPKSSKKKFFSSNCILSFGGHKFCYWPSTGYVDCFIAKTTRFHFFWSFLVSLALAAEITWVLYKS